MSEMSIDQTIENAVMNHDRLVDEVEALREALRLKEAECEALHSDVDHLYRVIHDASGKLYNDEMGEGDD